MYTFLNYSEMCCFLCFMKIAKTLSLNNGMGFWVATKGLCCIESSMMYQENSSHDKNLSYRDGNIQ